MSKHCKCKQKGKGKSKQKHLKTKVKYRHYKYRKNTRGGGIQDLATVDNAKALGIFAIKNADAIGKLGNSIAGWIKGKKSKQLVSTVTTQPTKKVYAKAEIDAMPYKQRMQLFNNGEI